MVVYYLLLRFCLEEFQVVPDRMSDPPFFFKFLPPSFNEKQCSVPFCIVSANTGYRWVHQEISSGKLPHWNSMFEMIFAHLISHCLTVYQTWTGVLIMNKDSIWSGREQVSFNIGTGNENRSPCGHLHVNLHYQWFSVNECLPRCSFTAKWSLAGR